MNRKISEKLISWKNSKTRKPLILYGARQVGKTYILKNFGATQFRKVFYLNFEEKREELNKLFSVGLTSRDIITRIEIMFQDTVYISEDLVIFDEIQECPRALSSLKYFAETMNELAVCSAGSHLGLALNDDSFPVGQVDILHLFPLDFEEFLGEENPQLAAIISSFDDYARIDEFLHARLWNSLKSYYITGGLPAAVRHFIDKRETVIEAFSGVRNIQKNLITGYTSDFAKHAGKENANHIHRIFENIPVQLSRTLDLSVKKYTFKGVIPQKTKYESFAGPIGWLVKSGLVIKVPVLEIPSMPLRAFAKENTFKLYLFDIGILGAMLNLPPGTLIDQDYGLYKGFFAENFTAQEFIASGVDDLHAWVHRTSEVEFLRVLNGKVVPVEVKSGLRTRAKSLAEYAGRYAPSKMITISGNVYHKGNLVINYPLYLAGKIGIDRE
jgi:predicted AAA+ superfamily ATPase